MAATREGAIARARTGFDDGSFIELPARTRGGSNREPTSAAQTRVGTVLQ